MTEVDIKQAPLKAWKNKKMLEAAEQCGCFQCLLSFPTADVVDWTDFGETGICPHCGCDCLIADGQGVSLDENSLRAVHGYWFSK